MVAHSPSPCPSPVPIPVPIPIPIPIPNPVPIPNPYPNPLPIPIPNPVPQNVRFLSLNNLKERVVFWGGTFSLNNDEVRLVNTCSFDNLLNALAVLYRMKPNSINQIYYPNVNERQPLLDILLLIENSRRNDRTNWNEAKKKFILDFIPVNERPVMTLISSIRAKKAIYQMDFYGSEDERFIQYLQKFQTYTLRQICEPNCIYNNVILGNQDYQMFINKVNNQVLIDYGWSGNCPSCNRVFDVIPIFQHINPQFLIVEALTTCFTFTDLPDILNIGGSIYKLLCGTMKDRARGHFVSLLKMGNDIIFVDGIGSKCELMPIFNPTIMSRRNVTTIEKHYKMPINSTLYYLI